MRIIQVNKFLYRKAGAEAYVLDLADLLRRHGHDVMLWGPDDPLNFDRRERLWRDLKKFGHMLWSFEAARKFEKVVREFKPDVVHMHNIYHHISPSILPVAKKYGVPVVMTVHDYHLINPNYVLYDHGAICERKGLAAIAHRCIKDSYAASFADVMEWSLHKWLRVYEKNIARYLVPTHFVKEKLIEGGVDGGKIEVVPLPVVEPRPVSVDSEGTQGSSFARPTFAGLAADAPNPSPPHRRSAALNGKITHSLGGDSYQIHYILYAGRLTQEKGIYLVLEMAKRMPQMHFKIAGDGPELKNLELGIPAPEQVRYGAGRSQELRNVELLGFVEKEKLHGVIAGARLILVPSLWYDPSPYAVLEAMAAGKAVVGSKIGGISQLLTDGETGFLAEPGNVAQWVDTIQKAYYDEPLLNRIGAAAHEYVRRVHNPETHYEKIMEMYWDIGL